jgi:hypothetical protein
MMKINFKAMSVGASGMTRWQLRTAHGLAQLFGHALEISKRYLASLIVVKQIKNLLDVFLCIFITLLQQKQK